MIKNFCCCNLANHQKNRILLDVGFVILDEKMFATEALKHRISVSVSQWQYS